MKQKLLFTLIFLAGLGFSSAISVFAEVDYTQCNVTGEYAVYCETARALINDGRSCQTGVGTLPKCFHYASTSAYIYCSADGHVVAGTDWGDFKKKYQAELPQGNSYEISSCEQIFTAIGSPLSPSGSELIEAGGYDVHNVFASAQTNEGRCAGTTNKNTIVGNAVQQDSGAVLVEASACITDELSEPVIQYRLISADNLIETRSIPVTQDTNGNIRTSFSTNIINSDLQGSSMILTLLSEDSSGNLVEVSSTNSSRLVVVSDEERDNQLNEVPDAGENPVSATSSNQFGACNCGGGVQCTWNDKRTSYTVTKYPQNGTEEYQCVLCLSQTGNTWVGGIGCINTTPEGIFLQLIRISMGVMGGVALLRLIFLGYQYQFGDEKQIQAARDGVLATLAAIVIVLFSVLILRIIGVNILDVVPSGFFGS